MRPAPRQDSWNGRGRVLCTTRTDSNESRAFPAGSSSINSERPTLSQRIYAVGLGRSRSDKT